MSLPSDGDDAPNAPPTSRFGRLARLTGLSSRALPMAAEAMRRKLGAGSRTVEEERLADERVMQSAKKTAEAMLKTLGEMKGLPLKLGQMASYIDGLAPPGYEERFQATLKMLQSKAPPLSAAAARSVIIGDLGAPPEEIFAEFEAEPFAAASIGQVHRAVTRSGDRVAVKVQYPGIDKAIANDLKSLSMLETMIAPVGRRYQSKETLEEVKAVFLAEIDYTREAETADVFRKIHEGDTQIVIPRVHHALSTRRVLTCDLMGGIDHATFAAEATKDDRDAAGETLARFMYRALYKHGLLYADPHPGNYRFLGGGRVAFLDFGCAKVLTRDVTEGMKGVVIALQDGNEALFEKLCVDVLGYDPTDPDGWPLYTEYTRMILKPLTTDARFEYTRPFAREAVAYLVRNGKRIVLKKKGALPNLPKPIKMPPEMTFVNRLQWGFASVLAMMSAEANWRALIEPWVRGEYVPPPT
jgi:predicted unusual protein kinase regulating ubiquinone biosynthesis (AarF/ABC1/UbiB family)